MFQKIREIFGLASQRKQESKLVQTTKTEKSINRRELEELQRIHSGISAICRVMADITYAEDTEREHAFEYNNAIKGGLIDGITQLSLSASAIVDRARFAV